MSAFLQILDSTIQSFQSFRWRNNVELQIQPLMKLEIIAKKWMMSTFLGAFNFGNLDSKPKQPKY
jgi:hypothetical protein